ncbi:MAG: DUF5714 domain-containing protein [Desulfuromonadaceae bacterium]
MPFNPDLWSRYRFGQTPVYVRHDSPCWFVPNPAGDKLLQQLQTTDPAALSPAEQRFLARLPATAFPPYPGRGALLQTEHLQELWLHITNRCNLACNHCLFSSGPQDGAELPLATLLARAREAYDLGCRIFALTGGEPLLHRDFPAVIDGLLQLPDSRIVILSNGLLLQELFAERHWDLSRIHLQISVDGLEQQHDGIRGNGAFARLRRQLDWLRQRRVPFTLAMCVERQNLADLPGVVDFAAEAGAAGLHFMWYFVQGRGDAARFVPPDQLFEAVQAACVQAERRDLSIDNLETLKTQIFAPSGSYQDGSGGGWESLAIGPDDRLYPSAALVGQTALATAMPDGLCAAWQQSPVLQRIRQATAASLSDPFRFLLGGGDLDHSYSHRGSFIGDDPYLPLYRQLALWLIQRALPPQADAAAPRLRLKMGDLLHSCGHQGAVALVHSNCLLSLAENDSRRTVKEFYSEAADTAKEDILNPICYSEELIRHIPEEFRFRGYGCGSPVQDADIQPGHQIVDLGCGRGIECFIAAKQVGPNGKVFGIDMLDPMLDLARSGQQAVVSRLGYDNLDFRQGYLEALPLPDDSADRVLSNCVMNLSPDKRQAFAEIYRVLKPGGRLVISDVVCEEEPPSAIKNDATLRGECIAGALTQKDLIGILDECGFRHIRLLKRFPYRQVQGHPFFSLTFSAEKPLSTGAATRVIYPGPGRSLCLEDGQLLHLGSVTPIAGEMAEALSEQVLILDQEGAVTNRTAANACACALPPASAATALPAEKKPEPLRHASGCMVCATPLVYLNSPRPVACHFCGQEGQTSALCAEGHFVCDACHAEEALPLIEHLCLASAETDMLRLLEQIRRHPVFPTNGPEHHGLVPGIILATCRNLGGPVDEAMIRQGIDRGARIIGGSCAYLGICGAATGVGVAFSLLLAANPIKAQERQQTQQAVLAALTEISQQTAARCCQRDAVLALQAAARCSETLLGLHLRADALLECQQQGHNRECQGHHCPLAPRQDRLALAPGSK